MKSFFPDHFNPQSAVVAVIAGRGQYPLLLLKRILQQGISCRLVALKGETDPSLRSMLPAEHSTEIHIGQLGKLLSWLVQSQSTHVMLAGQVKPTRLFSLKPDLRALFLLSQLKERNASTIFGTLCSQIEKRGITVLDARCFMECDIVQPSSHFPLKRHEVEFGIQMASEIARLNIGQSIVVKKGTVLAVEGFDGTNALLKHCRNFDVADMLFVKISKPHHDFRFDVPIFGAKTLELLQQANIRYAALESGKTIILDQQEVLKQAQQIGIEIFGY